MNILKKIFKPFLVKPAFDSEFDCIDFLTILKKESLSNSLADKFQIVR